LSGWSPSLGGSQIGVALQVGGSLCSATRDRQESKRDGARGNLFLPASLTGLPSKGLRTYLG
jgi:hypothetical protein